MSKPAMLKAILVLTLVSTTYFIHAQAKPLRNPTESKSGAKPFKVLTNGRQITLQAKQNFKSILVWTSSGHRIVEQKEMNESSHSFIVPPKENIVFLLVEFQDGNRYTEKIGVK